jgi:hypothetical protein
MKNKHLLLLATTITILFTACTKKNTQGKLVPNNAAMVLHVNGQSILSKLSWDEIKQNKIFEAIYSDSAVNTTFKKLLDDPAKAGIDINGDLLVYLVKDSTGGYVVMQGSVKDAAALASFNKELTGGGTASQTDGISFISKAPVCAGWSSEKFVYLADVPQMKEMDDLTKRLMRDSINIAPAAMPRDILAACKNIFQLKESNSLATDEKFSRLMEQKGDVHVWINSEYLNNSADALAALSMVRLDKLYKGNITTFTASFDEGKIVLNGHSYAGDELTKLFKKYSGGKVNEEMLKRMPGKNILALIGLNFKPEGLHEFLKLLNIDGFITLGLNSLGMNTDDFIKANKGDVVFGISDFTLKPDTSSNYLYQQNGLAEPNHLKPAANYVFAVSIKDKDAFNKLINAGKKLGGQYLGTDAPATAYNSNGNYFVLGNTKENTDQYLAGTNSSNDIVSKISGAPFTGYVNLQMLLKTISAQPQKDSLDKAMMEVNSNFWDNLIWKGGDFEDGGITQKAEIQLLDKNTNSLKQLNQYINKMGEMVSLKRKKQREAMMAFEDAAILPIMPQQKIADAPATAH